MEWKGMGGEYSPGTMNDGWCHCVLFAMSLTATWRCVEWCSICSFASCGWWHGVAVSFLLFWGVACLLWACLAILGHGWWWSLVMVMSQVGRRPWTILAEFEFCSKFCWNHLINLAGPSAKFDSSRIPGIAQIPPYSGRNQWRTVKTSVFYWILRCFVLIEVQLNWLNCEVFILKVVNLSPKALITIWYDRVWC